MTMREYFEHQKSIARRLYSTNIITADECKSLEREIDDARTMHDKEVQLRKQTQAALLKLENAIDAACKALKACC